jgi:hypothetical protein
MAERSMATDQASAEASVAWHTRSPVQVEQALQTGPR